MGGILQFLALNEGYILTGGISIVVSGILVLVQRYFSRKDFLNSRKDAWLKNHYLGLSGKLGDPFYRSPDFNYTIPTAFDFLNPKKSLLAFKAGSPSVLHIFDDHLRDSVSISKRTYRNQLFIKDEEVYSHLDSDSEYHKIIIDSLKGGIKASDEYVSEANKFLESIDKSIKEIFGKYCSGISLLPTIVQENDYAYWPGMMTDIVLSQLERLDSGKNVDNVTSRLDVHSTLIIHYGSTTIATIPSSQEQNNGLITDLNSVYAQYRDELGSFKKDYTELKLTWNIIDNRILEVKSKLKRSGIPIQGECKTCRETKRARRLVPP